MRQKIQVPRNVAGVRLALICSLVFSIGCTPTRHDASFFIHQRMFGDNDSGAETLEKVVQSRRFWSHYISPQIAEDLADPDRVRNSLRLRRSKKSDGEFLEVTLSVSHESETARAQVAAAVMAGLDQYFRLLNDGGPYVRK